MKRFLPFLMFSAMVASACGCILTAEDGTAADAPAQETQRAKAADAKKGPHAPADWKEEMLTRLKNDKTGLNVAWGFFSEGGWSDNGQVMIFAKSTGALKSATPKLALAPTNSKEVKTERALQSTEWTAFTSQVATAKDLSDVKEQVFDGLIYYYVEAHKGSDGVVKVEKEVTMKLGEQGQYPKHEALIKAFNNFKPEHNKAKK